MSILQKSQTQYYRNEYKKNDQWTKSWEKQISHYTWISSSLNLPYRTKFSSDKIFDIKQKFWQFRPIFAWILYWNIGQNFRRTKCFVGHNFRHQAEISTLLSDAFLSDKVCGHSRGISNGANGNPKVQG